MKDDKSRIFVDEGLSGLDDLVIDFGSGEDDSEIEGLEDLILEDEDLTSEGIGSQGPRDYGLSMSDSLTQEDDFNLFEEQEMVSDKDRFDKIVHRMRSYQTNKQQEKNKNKRLREFVKEFVDLVLEGSLNETTSSLTAKQKRELSTSARLISKELDTVGRLDNIGGMVESTLSRSGFPMELLYKANERLEWELQKLIQSTKMDIDELNNQYLMVKQTIVTTANDKQLNGEIYLTDVEILKYDMVRRRQTVVCPNCKLETEHNLLGFSKTHDELRAGGYTVLFEIRPLNCDCGELITLSESSVDSLDEEMLALVRRIDGQGDTNVDRVRQILLPTSNILNKIPEIEMVNEVNIEQEEEISLGDLTSAYSNYTKRIMTNELGRMLEGKTIEESELRFNILVKNSLAKTNVQGDSLEDLIVSTTLQLPLVIEMNNIRKRIRRVRRQVLSLTKVLKIMEYLLSDLVEEETEFDKDNAIRFVNDILTTELNSKELYAKDYEERAVARAVANSINDELKDILILKSDLESMLRKYKQELLDNTLVYYLPATITTNNQMDYKRLYNLFDSDEEIQEFRRKATEALTIKNWYMRILEMSRGRFQRSNKPHKEYEDNKSILKTLEYMSLAKKEDLGVREFRSLFNIDFQMADNCLSELFKVNSKYRFLYSVLGMIEEYSEDDQLGDYMLEIVQYVEGKYKEKYKTLDKDQFEKYFILLDLGFSKEEVEERIHLSGVDIDCRSLSLERDIKSLDEYLDKYDDLAKYYGERINLDNNCYEILLVLRKLEQWGLDKRDDMHREIKFKTLEYVKNEYYEGTGLFKYCDTLVNPHYTLSSEFEYRNITTIMDKGKFMLKDMFEENDVMNKELLAANIENMVREKDQIAFLDRQDKMTMEDALRRIMEESDISHLESEPLDIYLRYLISMEELNNQYRLSVEPLIPEEHKEELLIYYMILNRDLDTNEFIKRYTKIRTSELIEEYIGRIREITNEIQKVSAVTYEKLRVELEGDLSIEL